MGKIVAKPTVLAATMLSSVTPNTTSAAGATCTLSGTLKLTGCCLGRHYLLGRFGNVALHDLHAPLIPCLTLGWAHVPWPGDLTVYEVLEILADTPD